MTLTGAGPLIAPLDADDSHHERHLEAARALPSAPLLTTWLCFTEAMHLLGEVGGHQYQTTLWDLPLAERLLFRPLLPPDVERMAGAMERYSDVPMDLADAPLVATAEQRGLRRLFTVDGDFHVYRLQDGSALQIIP